MQKAVKPQMQGTIHAERYKQLKILQVLEISICPERPSLPKRTVPLPVAKMQEKLIAERNAVLEEKKKKKKGCLDSYMKWVLNNVRKVLHWQKKELLYTHKHPISKYRVKNNCNMKMKSTNCTWGHGTIFCGKLWKTDQFTHPKLQGRKTFLQRISPYW